MRAKDSAMAVRSLFFTLRDSRNLCASLHRFFASKSLLRSLSSDALNPDSVEDSGPSAAPAEDDLKSRIFRLRFPKRSATAALQRCVGERKKVTLAELWQISKDLRGSHRYKHALKLAKKYRPDANKNNPSAKRKFQEKRDANETLRDPEKRAHYDQELSRSAEQQEYSAGGADGFSKAYQEDFHFVKGSEGFGSDFSHSFHKIFSEIFEDETVNFATDIRVELSLSFSEAAKGCTKHLSFDAQVPCESCYGRGHPFSAKPRICPTCKGIGRVTIPPFTSTCSTCKGSGRIIKEYCLVCKGSGLVEGVKEVIVTIPAGVDSGDTIRVPKAGNSGGQSVHPGNLNIILKVGKDPLFVRDGADIHVDSIISFTQALLGGEVEVPTLSGKMQIKIPKGVQPGQQLVLRGRGLPKYGGLIDHGDQYVRFRICFPSSVNDRQRALLEEFAKEEFILENSASVVGNWLFQQAINWLNLQAAKNH